MWIRAIRGQLPFPARIFVILRGTSPGWRGDRGRGCRGCRGFDGLTVSPEWVNLGSMQLIIDVPEKLAQQWEGQRELLAEILQLGLCRRWSNA